MAKKFGKRDDAGSMLATVIVIVVGTGLCCFLSLMDTSGHGDIIAGSLIGAAMLLIAVIVWYRYRRDQGGNLAFWFAAARNHREDGLASQYRPRKVEDRQAQNSAGSNKPITAQEARELQVSSSNTWVPSGAGKKKK